MTPDSAPTVQQLLAFYLEAGVDCALTEAPVNRLSDPDIDPAPRETAPAPLRTMANTVPPSRSEAAPAPEVAILSAREAARTAPTLEALRALLENFDGCALKSTATRLVFADGNPQARIMFVGEAPGREEDIEGLPFVGRSGKLLDRMISVIGLDRTSAYIANVIPWRPPGNRTPTPQETQDCLPLIQRQIDLVEPDKLGTRANPSTQSLLACRAATNHWSARGTSGSRPGNRSAISGGGVPTVSDARQTTTPPVSLNFAKLSHGVRSGVASRNRCGRPASNATRVASCASPVTALKRWLVRRSKLSPQKCAIEAPCSEAATSPPPLQGRKSVGAITPSAAQ